MNLEEDKTIEYLYKYTPHNNDSRKYEILTKLQLWFSEIEKFNDPIDSKLDYREEYTKAEINQYWKNFPKSKLSNSLKKTLKMYGKNQSFVEQQKKVFESYRKGLGVLCFSKNSKNILMWSHYANNHKGIVYEFKASLFTDIKSSSFRAVPYKVDYPSNRSYNLLSYALTDKEKKQQFVYELLTKAKDWEYEKEYRMIDLENSGNKTFKKESLVSIIFGVKTSDIEIDIIKCICKKYGLCHIKFKKAQFKKGTFEIEISDI